MPLVTVVMPLYNKAADVERTLRYALRQSVPDFVVNVVDDGSTDGSAELVLRIADPRVRLLRQANAGVSAARNRGIEEAPTDLVALLDADDLWKPDFLKTVLDLHARFPDAGLWAAAFALLAADGRTLIYPRRIGLPTAPEGGLIPDFFAALRECAPVFPSSVMGRRQAFRDAGGFPVGERLAEDWDTWVRIALRRPVAYSPAVQVLYRLDSSNRAMNRLRFGAGPTVLERTLRERIGAPGLPPDVRESLQRLLGHHLLIVARDCIAGGHGARARQLLDEVRAMGTEKARWGKLRFRSYLGAHVNGALNTLSALERRMRHGVRGPTRYESEDHREPWTPQDDMPTP